MITIAFQNASTCLTDDQVKHVMDALQIQISRDFSPIWNVDCKLEFFPKSSTLPDTHWWLLILDDSDQAGALGYHDLTTSGLPVGKIFAHTDIANNLSWSVTASHELMEMLVDPYASFTVTSMLSDTKATIFALEVADACEDDADGYLIGDVLVSDFVTPEWFEAWRHGVRFDFCNKIKYPFEILDGGYIDIWVDGKGWQNITHIDHSGPQGARLLTEGRIMEASNDKASGRVLMDKDGHRSDRRRLHSANWKKSSPTG